MSNFFIAYRTGLLCKTMHKIIVFEPNAMYSADLCLDRTVVIICCQICNFWFNY